MAQTPHTVGVPQNKTDYDVHLDFADGTQLRAGVHWDAERGPQRFTDGTPLPGAAGRVTPACWVASAYRKRYDGGNPMATPLFLFYGTYATEERARKALARCVERAKDDRYATRTYREQLVA